MKQSLLLEYVIHTTATAPPSPSHSLNPRLLVAKIFWDIGKILQKNVIRNILKVRAFTLDFSGRSWREVAVGSDTSFTHEPLLLLFSLLLLSLLSLSWFSLSWLFLKVRAFYWIFWEVRSCRRLRHLIYSETIAHSGKLKGLPRSTVRNKTARGLYI